MWDKAFFVFVAHFFYLAKCNRFGSRNAYFLKKDGIHLVIPLAVFLFLCIMNCGINCFVK